MPRAPRHSPAGAVFDQAAPESAPVLFIPGEF